ncbi:MAG: transcriptional regulator [Sedimentibacter saalensis]|uniref:transcriptional regulator n=1 Tax=Sedimentibacter saalensis TaxID=130788 RepID=UPI002B1EDB0B|nr:transcriptional regulator [Sedimentibacter saalensis]MEA5094042.1 transcriptional regulator [Sedimentibacter saalensis]
MNFNDKLDFLMKITGTTNSALALYTSIDASHISRLRRGERSMPKNGNYLNAMSGYLARHCIEDYKKKALSDAMNIKSMPNNIEEISVLISSWLVNEQKSEENAVGEFLDELSNFKFKKFPEIEISNKVKTSKDKKSVNLAYYGVNGKRTAVIEFLSMVLSIDKPQTLLLYSDEDMDWLIENYDFKVKWAVLMSKVIKQGNKIKIIHTVSRDLHEILEAINEWMPLYMTGAIKPFYYPKKRDGVFKRTMFIAPENSAVISSSVGNMSDSSVCFLVNEKEAVKSITNEYINFLEVCRPMMRIFTEADYERYFLMLSEFEKEETDTFLKADSISILTMPKTVVKSVLERLDKNKKIEIEKYLADRVERFMENLKYNKFTEIITIPSIEMIVEGKIKVTFSDILNNEELYYTLDEFIQHLENILMLIQRNANYHVCINSDNKLEGYMLYVKEDTGVIVAKTSAPSVIFAINESNMTAGFWDYLSRKIDKKKDMDFSKSKSIDNLNALIDELKKYK